MDDKIAVRLVLGLLGLLISSVGVYGLVSGRAYFPPRAHFPTGPFVVRVQEPATFWPIVIAQTAAGILLGSLPWWRM